MRRQSAIDNNPKINDGEQSESQCAWFAHEKILL